VRRHDKIIFWRKGPGVTGGYEDGTKLYFRRKEPSGTGRCEDGAKEELN